MQKHSDDKRILILKRVGAVAIALLFWQMLAMVIDQKILLVSPWQVLLRFRNIWKEKGFWSSIWFTFYHIEAGFFIGVLAGICLAVLAKRFSLIETLLWPWMISVKAVPVASFIVICLVWFSAKNVSVFISFLIVLPVVYQNMLAGLKGLNKEMNEMAQVFRIQGLRKVRYIILPQLRNYIYSAFSIGAGMAWKAGVAAEVIGTPSGSIGKMLFTAKIYLDTEDLLAWTVIIVCMSAFTEKIIMMILRKLLGGMK